MRLSPFASKAISQMRQKMSEKINIYLYTYFIKFIFLIFITLLIHYGTSIAQENEEKSEIIFSDIEKKAFKDIVFPEEEKHHGSLAIYEWNTQQIVYKWNRPIVIGLVGINNVNKQADEFILEKIKEVSLLIVKNAPELTIKFQQNNINSVILVVHDIYEDEWREAKNLLKSLYPENMSDEYILQYMDAQRIRKRECYSYSSLDDRGYIASFFIVISEKSDRNKIKQCINTEFTRSFGLFSMSSEKVDSLFSFPQIYTELQNLDEKFIRFLYSDKIKPGMTKDEFMESLK
ncbi:DUF2927 domain-containing protein [Rhodospirillum sp. A1_3_36]|uniref:DUF2927 domain-containing protein n=1 Tax=Rhodospirillum sp. A1_3_36 TaxID=3391666 RepID=UPI0039A4740F